MKAGEIKEYIQNNGKIEQILEELGMHHIKYHQSTTDKDAYYSCAMPSGDNL